MTYDDFALAALSILEEKGTLQAPEWRRAINRTIRQQSREMLWAYGPVVTGQFLILEAWGGLLGKLDKEHPHTLGLIYRSVRGVSSRAFDVHAERLRMDDYVVRCTRRIFFFEENQRYSLTDEGRKKLQQLRPSPAAQAKPTLALVR